MASEEGLYLLPTAEPAAGNAGVSLVRLDPNDCNAVGIVSTDGSFT